MKWIAVAGLSLLCLAASARADDAPLLGICYPAVLWPDDAGHPSTAAIAILDMSGHWYVPSWKAVLDASLNPALAGDVRQCYFAKLVQYRATQLVTDTPDTPNTACDMDFAARMHAIILADPVLSACRAIQP